MNADLHIHTNYSDGTSSVEEIIQDALRQGVTILGITDHENTGGVEKAKEIGRTCGIEIIPGVEFCTFFGNEEIHLLAYYQNIDNDFLQERLQILRQERATITWKMYEKLKQNGIQLDWDQIEENAGAKGIIYKGHILRAIWNNSRNPENYDWQRIASWFKPGGMAFVAYEENPFTDTVDFIFETGGVPVLAHPGLIKNQSLIPELLAYRPIGLEVYYAYWVKQQENIAFFEKVAHQEAILSTGGSDFHGLFSPIGIGGVVVPEACVGALKSYLQIDS